MNSNFDEFEEIDNDPEEINDYTSAPKEKKKKRYLLIVLLILIFLFAVFCGYAGYLKYKYDKMVTGTQSSLTDEAKNLLNPGPLRGEDTGDINILFLGMRPQDMDGAYLSSAMMIVNVDSKQQKINLISIPRDLWIPIDGKMGKANSVYKTAILDSKKYSQGPVEFSKQTFSSVFGVNINYAFVVNFDGFEKIVDDAGSVNVKIPSADVINYPFLKNSEFVAAKDTADPYTYHLNGSRALTFVSWPRDAVPDFDRLKRMQLFLTQVRKDYITPSILLNPSKVDAVLTDGGKNIKMDFQVWEVKKLISLIDKIGLANISQHKLTTDTATDGGLLRETHYSNTTYNPISGDANFSAIQNWAKSIINN
ncbi:MAG: LCP family protein [Candidatus Berkelbacteria bacterium]|nr:LCP family protein [Candidatus Berkelbacteria bacterium]